MPPAEIDISTSLVRTLIRDQQRDLIGPLELVTNGWDNVIFRLDRDLAVRLPRRAVGAELLRHEQRWLPELAARLPRPVPVPLRTGRPTARYPWPWSVTRWFAGRTLAAVPLAERSAYAPALGFFLARLHFPAPSDAPANSFRGVPLAERDGRLTDQLGLLGVAQTRAVRALWPRLRATPAWSGPPVWLHGDPHPGNVIVRDDNVAAVIDFGDLTAGDPASDLALGWLAFDGVGRRLLRDVYAGAGWLDADTWTRARGWALCLAVAMIANSDDDPLIAGVGHRGLHQVLIDDQ